jgi:two-component system NtrC family sensor kinase
VPLLREGEVIGVLAMPRSAPGLFSDREADLVQTFADQAVIAIENVRLFDEVQARTHELGDLLEQQTATADILKVIASSPSAARPVFEAIAERSNRLINGLSTAVFSIADGQMHLQAFTRTNPEADAALQAASPFVLSAYGWGEEISRGEIVRILDTETDVRVQPTLRELARMRGYRSMLFVPLLRERAPIGMISVTRVEPGPFADAHVELLQTFADQAVIAIENARLFEEVRGRTRELQETLDYQTATADILNVISRSPSQLTPVLETIVETALRLCDAYDALLMIREGDVLVSVAHRGPLPTAQTVPVDRDWVAGRAVADAESVHVHDLLAQEQEFPRGYALAKQQGLRTVLASPLKRGDGAIGVLVIRRTDMRPFSDKQVAVLQTFADQAVIAIENVRLFEELQGRTRELQQSLEYQTATSDVLSVISRSTTDLQPVLDTLAESAARLSESVSAVIALRDGDFVVPRAEVGPLIAPMGEPQLLHRGWVTGRAVLDGRTIHVRDLMEDDEYPQGKTMARAYGHRATLATPLMREGVAIGAILVRRREARPFTEKQIALIETFADQAVIAIENTRLFEEVQARTAELTASLEDLRKAQDRLVQTEKLASLGQLTAGIAHEIKNPLNFVNNFADLSTELVDELKAVLDPAPLDESTREEVDELSGILRENLKKVVEHGRRADSIVKNMLLHSREGSTERRSVDVNATAEESLNLAYHGARAENPAFNVSLDTKLDPDTGYVDLYPQEFVRVLLNLISNGFYAAHKRKQLVGDETFEPTLTLSTAGFADRVEIRVRDNGTGIPDDVKAKVFNPFFTTKPAGEGTGLGLSLSHDIVVKQHGGTLHVDTRVGEFTEFVITLPRSASALPNQRSLP